MWSSRSIFKKLKFEAFERRNNQRLIVYEFFVSTNFTASLFRFSRFSWSPAGTLRMMWIRDDHGKNFGLFRIHIMLFSSSLDVKVCLQGIFQPDFVFATLTHIKSHQNISRMQMMSALMLMNLCFQREQCGAFSTATQVWSFVFCCLIPNNNPWIPEQQTEQKVKFPWNSTRRERRFRKVREKLFWYSIAFELCRFPFHVCSATNTKFPQLSSIWELELLTFVPQLVQTFQSEREQKLSQTRLKMSRLFDSIPAIYREYWHNKFSPIQKVVSNWTIELLDWCKHLKLIRMINYMWIQLTM